MTLFRREFFKLAGGDAFTGSAPGPSLLAPKR